PPGRPFVTAARDGARRVVAGACAAARSAGLRPGMSIAHANALVAGLAVTDANPDADEAGLRQLAMWAARRWSPIAAPDPPDGILIDATGCAHLFGGEEAMLARIASKLERAGVTVRAAIADTLGAAHAVARFGGEPVSVVAPGRTAETLARLPVAALRLEPEVAGDLHRFGFKRLGQLYGEPRAPLNLRFGAELGRRLDQALGRAFEAITPLFPEEAPRRRRAFAEPIGSAEALAGAAERLAADLCTDLERRGCGARSLDLLFERVDRVTLALRVGTARPSRDPRHLARLFTDRLAEVDPGFGVEAMVLVASLTEPLGARQSALADLGEDAGMSGDLAELVDRLANLPQVARVYGAAPVESDVPERTVRRIDPLSVAADVAWPALPRPFWLFAPQPVQTVALLPDDPPARFVWRGRAYRVRRADGPERIHLEWWRQASEIRGTRDYYRIEDEEGGRFWLFRDGRSNAGVRWFIHGVFG
ncbi:DUF6504 family protein, partial [Propylenella binzhouense]|uniref:DUF6504 family protein n=1 Tax=Propylenella binzhouense TaxID=2555902 RepID=UPI001967D1C7